MFNPDEMEVQQRIEDNDPRTVREQGLEALDIVIYQLRDSASSDTLIHAEDKYGDQDWTPEDLGELLDALKTQYWKQIDAMRALLADIETMRREDPEYLAAEPEGAVDDLKDHWFGAFPVGVEDRQTGDTSVQWPNLSITERKLRALLRDAD